MVNRSQVIHPDKFTSRSKWKLLNNELIHGLLYGLIGFVIARVSVMGVIFPFGISYFIFIFTLKKRLIGVGLGVLLGIFTMSTGIQTFRYLVTILMFVLIYFSLNKGENNKNINSIVIGCSNLLGGLFFFFPKGFYLYDIILLTFESLIIITLSLILTSGLPFTFEKGCFHYDDKWEKILVFTILTGIFLSGLSDIYIMGSSINNVFTALTILLAAYLGGSGLAAVSSIIFPLIYSLTSGFTPAIIGFYSLGGILGGTFREIGKIGIVVGFLSGIIFMNIFVDFNIEMIIKIPEIVAAAVLFLAIPKDKLNIIRDGVSIKYNSKEKEDIKEEISHEYYMEAATKKLNQFSTVLNELGQAFEINDSEEKEGKREEKEISKIYDEINIKACHDCEKRNTCWKDDFYNSYMMVFDAITHIENTNGKPEKSIPEGFSENCIKSIEVARIISESLKGINQNSHIEKQINEGRKIVSSQLKGLSEVIKGLTEVGSIEFDLKGEIEDIIYSGLASQGIKTNSIKVIQFEDDKFEIRIKKNSCYGALHCSGQIPAVVSGLLDKKVLVKSSKCNLEEGSNICEIVLIPADNYEISVGVSALSKKGLSVSGDSYSYNKLDNGRFMLAICDGMGAGEQASTESKAALNLIERFLDAGLERDLAVRTVNSVLGLRTVKENFTTLDLSLIDLHTGEANLMKFGSAASFIKRDERVEVISSETLPIGIVDEINTKDVNTALNPGDLLVMVSDGGICIGNGKWDPEERFKDIISELETENPQEIADLLMDNIMAETKGVNKDDITILVARLWERS